MKWLDDIRFGSKPITAADDFLANTTVIKNAQSGVSSIDNAIKNLEFKQVGDEIHVNNARFRDMEIDFRQGNVKKALDSANVPTSITSADESLLRKTLKNEAPDLDIAEFDMKISQAKKYHDDLDIKASSGADLESKLSTSSKAKATSMYTIIKTAVIGTGVAVGLFATMKITGNMYEDLTAAAKSRDGCFLVTKSTNTVACKLLARSCGGATENGAPQCTTEQMQTTIYNINLMVKDIIDKDDATHITALRDLGCDWADGATDLEVLSISENIPILSSYYSTMYPTYDAPTFVPCTLANATGGCVACNSSLPTNDIQYCTSSTLDSNMVYKCISDTTIIEALTDIATNLGIDLFSASGDSVSGSFQGNFFVIVLITLFIIATIALAIKFIPRKQKTNAPPETVSTLDKSLGFQPSQSNQFQQQQQDSNSLIR
ncbi:ODV-E56 [Callinectes sapidus nudivirus]|nr:ODV-E56 [Callinectes sapidus nudivirus]